MKNLGPRGHVGWLIGCLVALAGTVHAQEPTAPKSSGTEPNATAVVEAMCKYVAQLERFRVDVTLSGSVQEGRIRQRFTEKYRLWAAKPNHLAAVLQEGMSGPSVVYDGTEARMYLPGVNEYVVVPAAAVGFDAFFKDNRMVAEALYTVFPLTPALVSADPSRAMLGAIEETRYIGQAEVAGVACAQVKLVRGPLDWDVWVSLGAQPLPWRVEPDLAKYMAQRVRPPRGGIAAQRAWTLSDWQVEEVTEPNYAALLPADAVRVERFRRG